MKPTEPGTLAVPPRILKRIVQTLGAQEERMLLVRITANDFDVMVEYFGHEQTAVRVAKERQHFRL